MVSVCCVELTVHTYDIRSAKYDCVLALNGHATAVKELDAAL